LMCFWYGKTSPTYLMGLGLTIAAIHTKTFHRSEAIQLNVTVNYKSTGTISLWRSILGRSTEDLALLPLKTTA